MNNGKVLFLSPKQLKRALIILWKAKIPAAIFGGPGCGKTSIIKELVGDLNGTMSTFKLWPYILSYKGPEDIGGVPFPNKDKTRVTYLMPNDIPFDTDEAGIIFFDEFDRATTETQNSVLQVLLGGNIHGHSISKNAYCVIAMNGVSDIYTTQLSTAAITRVCTLFVSSRCGEFLDSYDDWAQTNNISPLMRSFARFTPDMLEEFETFEELAKVTPRTRDMADNILKVIDSTKFRTDDIIKPLIAGVIGKAGAIKLLAFRDLWLKAPDPLDILRNPDKAAIPTDLNILYALICALTARIADDRDLVTVDKLCKYFIRLPEEMAAMAFRRTYKKCNKIVTNNLYNKWSSDHKFILDLS